MRLTGRRLDSQRSNGQEIMSAMHATLGRGFFVLLNSHVNTPKKSVRLAFKPIQNGKRIDPLARTGCTRQTTFFVPRRDRQGQEDFILHQFGHAQFACHRQEITGVVFEFVLRHVGTLGKQLQKTIDIKLERNRFQTTLTRQQEQPANFQLQEILSMLTLGTLKSKAYAPGYFSQQIMQALQVSDSQLSFENTPILGEHKSVRNPFQS